MTPEKDRKAEFCCPTFYLAAVVWSVACCTGAVDTYIAPSQPVFLGKEKKWWKHNRLDNESGSGLFRGKKNTKQQELQVSIDSLHMEKYLLSKVKERMWAEARVIVQFRGTTVNDINCKLWDYFTFSNYIKYILNWSLTEYENHAVSKEVEGFCDNKILI